MSGVKIFAKAICSLLRVSDLLECRAGDFRRAAQMGTGYGFTVAHNIGKHHLHSRHTVPRDMTFGWNTTSALKASPSPSRRP
jgi:hypothetical protein